MSNKQIGSCIEELKEMLKEAKIPFKYNDGYIKFDVAKQIVIYAKEGPRLCDAIFLYNEGMGYSHGADDNKLEIMGALTEEELEDDNTLGWLTAEEVFKRFKYCYENSTEIYKEV